VPLPTLTTLEGLYAMLAQNANPLTNPWVKTVNPIGIKKARIPWAGY